MSARVMAKPTLSGPRNPDRTLPLAGLSVGLVIRARVQSRSGPVTASVIPMSSASALGNASFAMTGRTFALSVGLSRGSGTLGVARPTNRRTPASRMAATIARVPSLTAVPVVPRSSDGPSALITASDPVTARAIAAASSRPPSMRVRCGSLAASLPGLRA